LARPQAVAGRDERGRLGSAAAGTPLGQALLQGLDPLLEVGDLLAELRDLGFRRIGPARRGCRKEDQA
jgi:hypothetical protein